MLGVGAVDQVKKILTNSIEKNEIAGGNVMVIKGGKEIFYHEDGLADREAGLPIRRDSIFRLYSMSKPVTAAAVMILLERGEIDLYEPVSQFLDGFKYQMVCEGDRLVPTEREVTLTDLLSMTSGLVYGGVNRAGRETEALFQEIDNRLFSDSPMGTVEAMNKLGKCALAFQPGSNWQYGISADVLGAVVEVVSGKRFGEFLQKEIFGPLDMQDTGFWVPEEKRFRLVNAYADNGKGELLLYTGNHLGIINKMDREPAFESGGAGLVSTIDDYARFAKMLMNEGSLNGVQILRPKTVKYLTSGTLNAAQQKGFDNWFTLSGHSYGNLMRVMTDCSKAGGLGSLGEYGWDGWLGAYFCNCPKDDVTFLFMIQKTDAGTTALTRKLRNILLGSYCK
ncbi:serine hydrolase [Bacillus sp. AFS076308]|uniref:serine hydrolase domain-containing protein n=1 Tax=unclassified Bacillus (in: firmicutes) TaxID=185979 RepID=UPI000BF4307F|nr:MULTISPECIES: serine hydrolase domain-containing protein [unclassified Bacillus (in: firmicutes)]PFN97274.1 serine hydrolase [Bacillus sp. AFS076308]PGV51704.1 serine hydrolase [Bacillus sp. AFS037270]